MFHVKRCPQPSQTPQPWTHHWSRMRGANPRHQGAPARTFHVKRSRSRSTPDLRSDSRPRYRDPHRKGTATRPVLHSARRCLWTSRKTPCHPDDPQQHPVYSVLSTLTFTSRHPPVRPARPHRPSGRPSSLTPAVPAQSRPSTASAQHEPCPNRPPLGPGPGWRRLRRPDSTASARTHQKESRRTAKTHHCPTGPPSSRRTKSRRSTAQSLHRLSHGPACPRRSRSPWPGWWSLIRTPCSSTRRPR